MNPHDTENYDSSKRKFLSTAAKIAYIAPVVMSLPANAGLKRVGSNCDTKETISFKKDDFKKDDFKKETFSFKKDDFKKDNFKKETISFKKDGFKKKDNHKR